MKPKPSLRHAFAANLGPALILWCAAVLLLVLYYQWPAFHALMDCLAGLKERWGLLFVMPAQAIAAGVFPLFFQRLQRGGARTPWDQVPFLMLFWATQGAITSGFYTAQAAWFGDNNLPQTILIKTAVDMLLFTPLVSMPYVTWAYAFKDSGYSWQGAAQMLGKGWFVRRTLPVYMAALLVWTPAVCVLYALPLALQFPVQAIVQCFWGLILVIMTRHS